MKKLLVCIFALALCIALFGCSEAGTVTPGSTNTVTGNASEATNAGTGTESTNEAMATEEISETAGTTEATQDTEVVQATEATEAIQVTEATETVSVQSTDAQEVMVWVPTKGGTKYHADQSCSGMDDPRLVTKSQAKQEGFTACKKCYK